MIVYGSCVAPPARKVLAFIAEKGLAAEHRSVAPHDAAPAFRAASPFGQIPAFVDDAVSLCDSTAICHYLERRHPEPALFPRDPALYGRMVWLDRFADGFLGAAECRVVINRVVKPALGERPDAAVADQAIAQELPPLFDYLETQIAGPFLVGDRLTLADLAVASPFASLALAGYVPDARRWPRLCAYAERMLARPSLAGRDESIRP